VEFTKPPGQNAEDCLSTGVCLTRGETRALYNSLQEDEAPADGVCRVDPETRSKVPTFTEWVRKPCATAGPSEFVSFLSESFACPEVPRRIVGVHSCLRTTDGDDQLWDIQFTDWCPSARTAEEAGCFSYVRWHAVDDGEACP
jgi:hypothetical protein